MYHKTQFILLVLLSIFDAMTTVYFLEYTGMVEGNPIVAYLLEKFGYLGALVFSKICMLIIIAWTLYQDEVDKSKFVEYGMWFLVTYYIFVVTWNLIGIIA